MKRSLHIIALILSFALLLVFSQIALHLPGDSGTLIEKKYNSWSGVLRAWVSADWSCSGSFVSWLNRCAVQFEKDHPGIYIEFTSVPEQALHDVAHSTIRPPELLFYSPGLVNASSVLEAPPDVPGTVTPHDKALPVCMGAYAWVINTALCETIPDVPVHPADNPGRQFSRAAEGLGGSSLEIELTDPGIDLGLTAASPTNPSFAAFISGELPALIISQYELGQLIRLRDAGKGPDWRCIPSGSYMYADQLLLGAVTAQQDKAAAERSSLAWEFLLFLLSDECQQQLTTIGAFPSTSLPVYPSSSAYSVMEGMLRSLPLVTPEPG